MNNKNSKIKELYSSFSSKDLQKIAAFLDDEGFNKSDILKSLHWFLSEYFKSHDELDKKKAFYSIHPVSETYSDAKMRVYLTKLTKLLETYIFINKSIDYPTHQFLVLSDYYLENKLSKNLTSLYNSPPSYSFSSYYNKLKFEFEVSMRKINYYIAESHSDVKKINEQMNQAIENHKKLVDFQTLIVLCDYLSLGQMFQTEANLEEEEKKVQTMLTRRDELEPMVQNYLSVYLLYQDLNETEFERLQENFRKLNKDEYEVNQRFLLTQLQNFCIRLINTGKSEYLNKLFDIYQDSLGLYKQEGDLSSANFRNIVYCALSLNKVAWAENFVENYYMFITEPDQQNAYNFCYARIYFERNQYEKAMRQLLKVEYEDVFYAVTARILLIKCYFELDETFPLISNANSLNQYLQRNKKISKARIQNTKNFVKFTKQMQKNRVTKGISYFKKLTETIEDSKSLEKEWLIEKAEELSGVKKTRKTIDSK